MRSCRKLHSRRSRSALLAQPGRAAVWLYRLAVRHVLLYRRKTGRAGCSSTAMLPQRAKCGRWLKLATRMAAVRRAHAWFKMRLKRLPPRDADLLILKHADGLNAREIAERLGVAVATIETPTSSRPRPAACRARRAGRRIRGKPT